MLKALRTCLTLASLATASLAAHADEITFLFGADPQYEFYSSDVKNTRTDPTMIYASLIAAKCTECSKVFVIAGDLSHDGDGHDHYGAAYSSVLIRGVKIIDGLGNHDVGLYAPEQTSFTSIDGIYRVWPFLFGGETLPAAAAARKAAGWDVYDLQQGHVDYDEPKKAGEESKDFIAPCGTFNWRKNDGKEPPAYCLFPFAYYYTIALKAPGTDKVVAYLVQLQNAMRSKTAVAYLTRVRDKLVAEGKQDTPVILVGHSVEGSDDVAFKDLVRSMNVAAILYGHYHCSATGRDKTQGHCDAFDRPSDFVNADISVTNVGGKTIPALNGNAIFHNIFWIVSLDTDQGLVKWKRINRGGALDATNFQGGSIQFLIDQMGPAAYNYPTGAGFDEQKYAVAIPTGKWVGYFADGRKSAYVWSITRSGEDLTYEDVGTSNSKVKFTGKILGRRISDSGNKIGTISDDLQTIVWSDGVKWVRRK